MAGFLLGSKFEKGVLFARPEGYIDRFSGQELFDLCCNKASTGIAGVILNFSGSPVINSIGLSIILDLISTITQQHNAKVAICGLSYLSRSAFQTIGILSIVNDYPSEGEAFLAILEG